MANKQGVTAWKAVEKNTEVQIDDGDILNPLRKVAEQYHAKAEHLKTCAYGEHQQAILDSVEMNLRARDNVLDLVYVDLRHAGDKIVAAGIDLASGTDMTAVNGVLVAAGESIATLGETFVEATVAAENLNEALGEPARILRA